jgi:hypothetical protein
MVSDLLVLVAFHHCTPHLAVAEGALPTVDTVTEIIVY